MAASDALHAFGFEVEVSTNGSSYSDVLEIVNCNSPELIRAAAKATHNGSPDQHTEQKPGIKSTGPLMFTVNYVAAQYTTLRGYWDNGTELYWKVKFPLDEGEATPAQFVVIGFIAKLGQVKMDPEDTQVMIYDVEIARSKEDVEYTEGA